MKKTLLVLFVYAHGMLLTSLSADQYLGYTFTENGNGTVEITGYTGPGGAITIPQSIHGKEVVSIIGINNNNTITSIQFDNPGASTGLRRIDKNCFRNLANLSSITLPAALEIIEESNTFGGRSMMYCPLLTEVNVHPNNSFFSSVSGIVFSKNGSILKVYPCGRAGTYTVPPGVTHLENHAFAASSGLTGVTIPSGVTEIGQGAFRECNLLANVVFETFWNPATRIWHGVGTIKAEAFRQCNSLISIIIPRTTSLVSPAAFLSATNLTAIEVHDANANYSAIDGILYNKTGTRLLRCPEGKNSALSIPNTVTTITESAFQYCQKLTSVRLPSSVQRIDYYAFYGCSGLTDIRIPPAIEEIQSMAFAECSALSSAFFAAPLAPTVPVHNIFDNTSAAFQIFFRAGSTGYTTPLWLDYPCSSRPNNIPIFADLGNNRVIAVGQSLVFSVEAIDHDDDDLSLSATGE